ncbi:MAG: DNA polymerase/3'-5' exonuclease PolX [Actinomycetia bacterium]|nr:DNA polymerase/3'-5' exonuclease PolX [Actinomycetes bacterium]
MDKQQISKILAETATLLELKDENPFKIRAYQNAARALESSTLNLSDNPGIEKLVQIKGIGKKIAEQILQMIQGNQFELYQQLKQDIPPGLVEMLKIPTLGPRKIKYLYHSLGIESISELELACNNNTIAALPNFGSKTQQNILKGIETVKKFRGNFLYAEVIDEAAKLLDELNRHPQVIRASMAGSLRRKKEVVKDIDLVASSTSPAEVMDFFISFAAQKDIIARGETKSSITLKSGINADLRIVEDYQYPYALHHFTGSREHNTAMRSRSKKLGIKMNEYGLFEQDKLIECSSEEDLFKVFSMSYIPPELRENLGEIEAAKNGILPRLIQESDIRGLFHIHTSFSDGNIGIDQVCKFLKDRGMQYAGISDHSQTAAYAHGVKEKDVEKYLSHLQQIEKEFEDFSIFKGIESDILPDGNLDYSSHILAGFDFVIAAIHSSFNMDEQAMTNRVIKAIENPHTTILAHPTGRILLAREPYKLDIIRVINAAAAHGVAIEINANPHRLDLDWRLVKYARDKKVKIFISPDAHHLAGLEDYKYGINTARKGWLTSSDVANTMNRKEMKKYLKSMKGRK